MNKITILLLAAAACASCSRTARIGGNVVGGGQARAVYLEQVSPFGTRVADSVAGKNGRFSFRVKLADGQPAFYNIRSGEHLIPLLVSPGERLTVKGFGNISRNYTVNGSEGSAKLRELAMTLNNGAAALDSLTNLYTRLSPDDTTRAAVSRDYGRTYYRIKREQVRFIITNAGSLAGLYALYQSLPGDMTLFNGEQTDVVYYRTVADSLSVTHPGSPYLRALLGDIVRMTPIDPGKVRTVSYPDIELPDMYGHGVKLSSFQGGVVLIDFWSAAVPRCRLVNAELKELYERLHPSGFEVYQVSVDEMKTEWVNAVLEQKLPWASVCDFRGAASPAVRTYNVGGVPANFLLDRQGNLVGRNLYGDQLAARVAELL